MTPERKTEVRAELNRREGERNAQAAFGWHEILARDAFEPTAERFFASFFPDGERRVPAPYITWDVLHATSPAYSPEQHAYIDDLHRKILPAMKRVFSVSEWLVLENINHPWFRINLHSTPEHIEKWPVDLLPWADPCHMVAIDFSCGFIADMDRTITAFGQPLLDAIHVDAPRVFAHIVESG